jgi:glycosyltransferase involved in cell wall biosynthesis
MKKMLLVSHQLDYSGAPFALLAFAKVMRQLGISLDLVSMKTGPLAQEFASIGVNILRSTDFLGYNLIILNTSLCAGVSDKIPVVAKFVLWLHESPSLFVHTDIPLVVAKAAGRAAALLFPSVSTAKEWSKFGPLRDEGKLILSLMTPVAMMTPESENKVDSINRESDGRLLRLVSIDPCEYFRGPKVLMSAINLLATKGFKIELRSFGGPDGLYQSAVGQIPNFSFFGGGRAPRSEVLKGLAMSDMYISTTSHATQNLGLCEASLVGVPAVVSDIDVHKELARLLPGSIWLHKLFDDNDLSQAIMNLHSRYGLIRDLAVKNSEIAKVRFSFSHFAKAIQPLIHIS